ncbi:MAG: DNA translocase FtsK [Acidimicrobiia bacterium]|nr:MAG: DNA translocase FtsK [Acidimicrobiia bacterium]
MAKRAVSRGGATRAGRGSKKTERSGIRAWIAEIPTRVRHRLGRQADDVWGALLCVIAVLLVLSFLGQAGPAGLAIVATTGFLFGLWAYLIPLVVGGIGVSLIVGRPRKDHVRTAWGLGIAFVASQSLFHLLTGPVSFYQLIQGRDPFSFDGLTPSEIVADLGGAVGSLISLPLHRLIGTWGAGIVLGALLISGVLVATQTTYRQFFLALRDLSVALGRWARSVRVTMPRQPQRPHRPVIVDHGPSDQRPTRASRPGKAKPKDTRPEPEAAPVAEEEVPVVTRDTAYQLPPLELLGKGAGVEHNRRSLEETADALEETLRHHGVDASLTKIVPGPTVTRYEIELAPGVKVNRVTNLAHDIAYALATPDVRLLAPIPGKSAIGVEVPNKKRRLVLLGDVLGSKEAAEARHPLEVALGMDISGRPLLLNLAELPHVLIAGATGAGKSSCINSIVTSLLMRTHPEDVRLVMVDPKRVELGQYNGVPHLLTKVITNPRKAADALKWTVEEMDRRYDLLADAGVRDIVGYRQKLEDGGLDPEGFDRFPYLVVLIDELNDLMMVAGREVEDSIVRIAQMARAVGIHLVIATQRPSVNVITGVIKANVPSRLAFSVASQTDSRVIIDSSGAEKLIGMGDMLVVTAKEPRPRRIQGAWVEEDEVHAVVDWVKAQREARYQDAVIEASAEAQRAAIAEEDDEDEVLVRQAIELVVTSQLGSTSMLQRKLRIGFARAGRVMDILESRGVVGPSLGSKAREVLWTVDDLAGV